MNENKEHNNIDQLYREYWDEVQDNCDHPEEEQIYGQLMWVNNFHGFDQRVTCKLCGLGRWW